MMHRVIITLQPPCVWHWHLAEAKTNALCSALQLRVIAFFTHLPPRIT